MYKIQHTAVENSFSMEGVAAQGNRKCPGEVLEKQLVLWHYQRPARRRCYKRTSSFLQHSPPSVKQGWDFSTEKCFPSCPVPIKHLSAIWNACSWLCSLSCTSSNMRPVSHRVPSGLLKPNCDSTPGLIFAGMLGQKEEAGVSISLPWHRLSGIIIWRFTNEPLFWLQQ